MSEPVVRVSQGFFEPHLLEAVETKLREGRASLEPALKALRGLLHYYVAVDTTSNSMVNVSVWESVAAAQQMDTLRCPRDRRRGITFRLRYAGVVMT